MSGLKAAILEKDGSYALAIRGTKFATRLDTKFDIEIVDDIIADKQIALQEPPRWQLDALKEFVSKAQYKFKIDKIDIATGHSKGATLATLWGIENGVSVIGYDAPPDQDIAHQMFGEKQVKMANVIKIQSSTNPINSFGKQVGQVFKVKTAEGSYQEVNLDIFSDYKIFLPIINSDLVGGIKDFISLTGKKTVYGTSIESVAKEHDVDPKQISKKYNLSGQERTITSIDIHSDSRKEQLIEGIYKSQEYIIHSSPSALLDVEMQSLIIGGILHVGLDRHKISKLSESLVSGQELIPQDNNGSINFVIDKYTNVKDPDCQIFIKQIMPALEKHPAFNKMSQEEVRKLVMNNLPEASKKLRTLFRQ